MWQRAIFHLTILALVIAGALPATPIFAADPISVDDTGLVETGDAVYGELEEGSNIGYYIGARVIQPLLALTGSIFFLLIIYAGLLWMTAGGVKDRVDKAKHILVNSVIGLVIMLASYAVTIFILNALTSTGTTT